MAPGGKDAGVGEALLESIERHYNHLIERAADRWDENDEEPSGEIAEIYDETFTAAESAFKKGAYRRALELARGAEALTHVRIAGLSLEGVLEKKKLKG